MYLLALINICLLLVFRFTSSVKHYELSEGRKYVWNYDFRGKEKGVRVSSNSLISLVGDVGLEPTASGSGDQRSIQLS